MRQYHLHFIFAMASYSSVIAAFYYYALFCFCLEGEVGGQCPEQQSSLLLRLKKTLVFDSSVSTKLVEWNSGTDCCSWPGVSCSENDQNVTALDLSSENIESGFNGSSPLFELTSLTILSLADNSLDTPMSSEFGKLLELMHLNLSRAGFYGQVPVEISNLTRLVTLDLTSSFRSSLAVENPNFHMLVGNLTKLEELRLDNSDLTTQAGLWGQVLSSSVPNLQVLSLKGCGLSGPIHASLGNLTSLNIIDLSSNNFSVPFSQLFCKFKNLTSLSLVQCGFSGTFPPEILQVQSLRSIDLAYNTLLRGSLPAFSHNSSLETLAVPKTMFSNTIPESVGNLKMLSKLVLNDCNFTGPLPVSIAKLTRLVSVDLSANSFSGSLPSFSRSKNLTNLDLSDNSLSGSIQTSLFAIPTLSSVFLQHNQFTGFTEDSIGTDFSQLSVLHLEDNKIEGSMPTFIYGLKELENLDLSFNNFSGAFHISSLHHLKKLQLLDLSHNKLSVEHGEGDYQSLSNLKFLSLVSCKLKTFPGFIQNLYSLLLTDNLIHGEIPSWIWNLDTLGTLNVSHNFLQNLNMPLNLTTEFYLIDLSHNRLEGELPTIFPSAFVVDLSHNNFFSSIPWMAKTFSYTEYLSLSSNKLAGTIPESVCNSSKLEILVLSDNFLTGTVHPCLMQMPRLGVVDLKRNRFSGTIPDSFLSNCSMNTLDLNGNTLQGTVPKSLEGCRSLKILDLGNNKLHDTFPCWMRRSLTDLSVLVLRSNLFYGTVQCSSTNWTRLQILDLASNSFRGNLPARQLLGSKAMQLVDKESNPDILSYEPISGNYYGNTVSLIQKGQQRGLTKILTTVTAIDFSGNKFEGEIPCELGYLKALRALNISGNMLSGRISACIGNLTNLESLDLSSNELNGSIPAELAGLTFLAFLNLSYNHLEGPIPKGPQLQTFLDNSFQGNKDLCGTPLKKTCVTVKVPPKSPSDGADGSKPSLLNIGGDLILTEVGYAVGLGLVIMPLIFWSRWRMRFYEFTDLVFMRIFCRGNRRMRRSGI